MTVETEAEMGRKKSEERKHTGLVRISAEALDAAKIAAAHEGKSVADFMSDLVLKHAPAIITRKAKRYAKGQEDQG